MSEQATSSADDWSDHAVLDDEPPRKRRIPGWVWGCGCGCLVATVLAILAVGWVVRKLSGSFDPEKQWEQIGEVLPYDERPSNVEPLITGRIPGGLLGVEGGVWGSVMKDDSLDLLGVLVEFAGETAGATGEIFGGNSEAGAELEDEDYGRMTVQGRETRFLSGHGESKVPLGPRRSEGTQLWIDLTVEGAEPLMIMLVDIPDSRSDARKEIAPDDVEEFLRGFRVWDRP